MLQFDLDSLDTARVGRMGELVVELQLLARGWLVGNFNATTANSAGWDLFATRGQRTVKIRVKAKRPGVSSFVWSLKKDGSVFPQLRPEADDDFVAAVSFQATGLPAVYVLPALKVQEDLLTSRAAWLAGAKRDGTARKDTTALRVHLDGIDAGHAGHGFLGLWGPYRNAWEALERGADGAPVPPARDR